MFRNFVVNLSLMVFCILPDRSFAQEDYNQCSQALYLCPLVSQTINNIDANKSFCGGCEDDFTFCFTSANTIWLRFETNATGGNAQLTFSNIIFETDPNQGTELQATILEAIFPCDATTYTALGNCEATANNNFTLTANGLLPNTTYYVVINGATNGTSPNLPAEATMNVVLYGNGVERVPPGVALLVPNDTLCAGESMFFSAYVGDCPDTTNYFWYINGELVAETIGNDFETSALKHGDILSVATSCFEYCQVQVTDTTLPFTVLSFPVDAGPDFYIKAGDAAILQGSTTATDYYWSPPYTLSSPAILNPAAIPEVTTSYFLIATQDGCTFSDKMTVFVEEVLNITNTFTPNGDGFNDTWEIPSLDNYPNCLVQIFDRWGQSLYQTTGYGAKKAWDGRSNGRVMDAGVYFYVIDPRDPKFNEPVRGSLTLIK